MNTKPRKLSGRIAVLTLLVLMLVGLLSSCAGSGTATPTYDPILTEELKEDSGLKSAEHLNDIAKLLTSTYSTKFDTQEMLVAASRGYDMTVEGFTDPETAPDNGASTEAMKNLIAKANEAASTDVKLTFDYSEISASDMEVLVDASRQMVETSNKKGALDTVLCGIGTFLQWMTNTLSFGSYLVGICLFAVIIELLMLPFAVKQQKNSIRQAKLRPKEMAIKNKYKGRTDQVTMQKQQQEIQELYQRENFSPFSGCLPLLLQLPIIMALYNLVINPLRFSLQFSTTAIQQIHSVVKSFDAYAASTFDTSRNTIGLMDAMGKIINEKGVEVFKNVDGFTDKISGPADIPNLSYFGDALNLADTPSFTNFNWLLLVPLITFGVYLFTTKITKKLTYQPIATQEQTAGCSGKVMEYSMPLMSTFFTFLFPAAIGIYWIFKSFSGLAKQALLSIAIPIPKFTDADYKAAEKKIKESSGPPRKIRPGVKSLHRIDDDDEDTLPQKALPKAPEKTGRTEKSENTEKPNAPVETAALKDDSDRQERKKDKKKKD